MGALAIDGVTASIGKIPVLRGVRLRVEPGETVALLGRNGVGKTSTLRAVLGLLKRTGGTATYNGVNLDTVQPHKLAALGIGYVPQGRGMFPLLSVKENLTLGLTRAPDPEIMADIFRRFPRLEERLSQAAGTLSGGEQQMLALARCLVMKPSLIMLDEPSCRSWSRRSVTRSRRSPSAGSPSFWSSRICARHCASQAASI